MVPRIPAATRLAVPTPNGPRDLCTKHAAPFFAPRCGADPHDEHVFRAAVAL